MLGDRFVKLLLAIGIVFAATACSSASKHDENADLDVRSGSSVEAAAPELEIAWERESFGDANVRGLFSDGDLLYVQTADDTIHALGRDGVHRWLSNEPTGRVTAPPAPNGWGVVLTCGSDVFVFDRNYGNLTLKKHLPVPPSAAPVATDSTLYVPTFVESQLRTFDLDTGLSGWRYRTSKGVNARPALVGTPPRQMIYVAGIDGKVAALPAIPASGFAPASSSWSVMTHAAVSADLADDGSSTVFVASEDTKLYAVDRVTGFVQWSAPLGEPLVHAPIAVAGHVFQHAGDTFHAIDAITGEDKWQIGDDLGEGAFVAAGAGGSLYVYDGAGTLHEVDPATGSVYRTYSIECDHLVAHDGLLVTASGDLLTAHRL